MTVNLGERLVAAAHGYGGEPALEDDAETLSYASLADHAEVVAHALRRNDLGRSEPVVTMVSNRARDVAGLLGTWLAGGVIVPLHRRATRASLMVRAGARFAVDVYTNPDPVLRLAERAAPRRSLLDDAAAVIFTSGSTGEPKGVVIAHERFSAKLDAIDEKLDFRAGTRTLLLLQLTFSFGQWVTLLTLLRGGAVRLVETFRASDALARLTGGGIDRVGVVPTMLRAFAPQLSDAPGFGGEVMSGGEILPATLGRRFRAAWPDARLGDIYGLTETGTCDFFVAPERYDTSAGSIGVPGRGVDYRIAETDAELQLRTPYRMLGYLDRPDLTAAACDGGWLRTGDAARVRADGCVELIGRLKQLINRAGNKISPVAIERAFQDHPDVAAAMAVGVPDPQLGEAIHLLIVPEVGAAPSLRALRAWASDRLERYELPDHLHIGRELPVGGTGKADRNALRSQIIADG